MTMIPPALVPPPSCPQQNQLTWEWGFVAGSVVVFELAVEAYKWAKRRWLPAPVSGEMMRKQFMGRGQASSMASLSLLSLLQWLVCTIALGMHIHALESTRP